MARKPKDLETGDDLRESIQHLDQVSGRVARLLADLAAPKSVPIQEAAESRGEAVSAGPHSLESR
jgi:hypothetical protein